MTERIGFVGLGRMGLPMARHLMDCGYSVCGAEANADRVAEARAAGVEVCAAVPDIAERSEIVIVAVGFDDEVLDVITGEAGLLSRAHPGLLIAVASTVTRDTMKEAATAAAERGAEVIDMPLCRGEQAAKEGNLLILVGARKAQFVRCENVFRALAGNVFHVGELGAGQIAKMINNYLLWACYTANWEGLKLGEALGVDADRLREALLLSSGNNWALETWLQPRPMPWAERDMSIVADHADIARLPLPLCGAIREVVRGIKIERGLPTPPPRRAAKF